VATKKNKEPVAIPFLNPFDKGVSYIEFFNSIPKGKKLEEHLNKKVSQEELDYLKKELSILKLI
jgi:hypothetical protein